MLGATAFLWDEAGGILPGETAGVTMGGGQVQGQRRHGNFILPGWLVWAKYHLFSSPQRTLQGACELVQIVSLRPEVMHLPTWMPVFQVPPAPPQHQL